MALVLLRPAGGSVARGTRGGTCLLTTKKTCFNAGFELAQMDRFWQIALSFTYSASEGWIKRIDQIDYFHAIGPAWPVAQTMSDESDVCAREMIEIKRTGWLTHRII